MATTCYLYLQEIRRKECGLISEAYLFYEILVTKENAYDAVLEALQSQCQSGAAQILAFGKAVHFDLQSINPNLDPIAQTKYKFTNPPRGFRDFYQARTPLLVISTHDITVTTKRLQAECILHKYHVYSSKEDLQNDFETSEGILLVAMHGQKIRALQGALEILKRLATGGTGARKCILITTEGKYEVDEELKKDIPEAVVVEDNLRWNDLGSDFQQELLTKQILFQSLEMTLQDFQVWCGIEKGNLLDKLETKLLIQLINDEKPVFCENTLGSQPTPFYYIPRKIISRSLKIAEGILDKSPEHTSFAVTGMSRASLLLRRKGHVKNCDDQLRCRKPGISAKFLTVKDANEFESLCKRVGGEHAVKNLHWLKFNGTTKHFEWMRTYGEPGSIEHVQSYITPPAADSPESFCESEQNFISKQILSDFDSLPAICISDNPGMGKTTLLAHIGHSFLRHFKTADFLNSKPKFVQYFAITQLMRDLEGIDIRDAKQLKKQHVLQILLARITRTEITRHVFQTYGSECELMLDGFDEVLPHQAKLAVRLISILRHQFNRENGPSFRIWLTTRPVLLELVEKTLGVLGYNMLPFTEDDQKSFLQKYWAALAKNRNVSLDPAKLVSFSAGCLQRMEKVNGKLSPFEVDMTGIPLQCLLLAQVCEGAVIYECALEGDQSKLGQTDPDVLAIKNMADLYHRVMEKKLEIFLNRESSNSHLESHLSKNNAQVMKRIHMKLALQLLFPQWLPVFEIIFLHEANVSMEELSIYGIVTEYMQGDPVFVHRTYAEYFVALFAVEIGTCERLIQGFRVTTQIGKFYVDGVLASRSIPVERRGLIDLTLAEFETPVVTYFIDELLELRMAKETIPQCFLNAVAENLDEIKPNGTFNMEMSKIVTCATSDRPNIAKLLVFSMDDDSVQVWLNHSRERHTKLVYATALMGTRECLEIICGLLEKWNGQTISELAYEEVRGLARNPILAAVKMGNRESVEYLLVEKGFKPEEWAKPEHMILHHCVRDTDTLPERAIELRKDIINFLVTQEPNILEHLDSFDRTPLVTENVHIELRSEMIALGADVLYSGQGGQVLHMLGDYHRITPEIYQKFVETIEKNVLETVDDPLIQAEAFKGQTPLGCVTTTPNWHDTQDTALHLALAHLEVNDKTLELFNKYDFNWDEKNDEGYTVLHIAIKYGRSLRLIKKLINDFKANWIEENETGMTTIHIAAAAGNAEFLEWICDEYNFDINEGDYNQRSALQYGMLAPEGKRLETVKVLMENGADGNVRNFDGDTPLIHALSEGKGINLELLEYLKGKGTNILGAEENDKHGVMHALYCGANEQIGGQRDLEEVVSYLVEQGADLVGKDGTSNLVHLAAENGWLIGLKLLEKLMETKREQLKMLAREKNQSSCTPIYYAIKNKKMNAVTWLINILGEGVLQEACGENGVLPVHICAKFIWLEGMELLVHTHRVEVMARDDNQNTVFHYLHSGEGLKSDMIAYLLEKWNVDFNTLKNANAETPEQYASRLIDETPSIFEGLW